MPKIINDLSHRWGNNWNGLEKRLPITSFGMRTEVKTQISNNSPFHACFFSMLRKIPLQLLIYVCPWHSQSANWHHGAEEISSLTHFCFACLFPGNPPCPSHPWSVLAGCGRRWPGCHQLAVAAPSCGVAAGWWWLGWGWVPVFQPNACFFNPAPVFLYLFLTNQLLATIREMLKLW